MNIPKRHHYVPEMLQKNFVSPEGGLWTFDHRNKARGVWCGTMENLLLEGHLYSHVEVDGTKDPELELWFSELEGFAAPLVDKVLVSVRKGKLPQFSRKERETWDFFFYQQWRRVPDLFNSLLSADQHKLEVEKLIDHFDRVVVPISETERRAILQPETLKRMHKNLRVSTLKTASGNVLDVIAQRGLAIAHIERSDKSFVIGSHPVVKLTPPDVTYLGDPRVELWLPIAHDVMVGLGQIDRKEICVPINDPHIRSFNEAAARQSSQIVSRSRKLTASLSHLVGTKLQLSSEPWILPYPHEPTPDTNSMQSGLPKRNSVE